MSFSTKLEGIIMAFYLDYSDGVDREEVMETHKDKILTLIKEELVGKDDFHVALLANKDDKLVEGRTVKDWIRYGKNQCRAEILKRLGGK